MAQAAYVLRISPSGKDKVPEALETNTIIIGWSNAIGLLDESLSWEDFRDIIRKEYYSDEINLRRSGNAGGHMWRFIRDMKQDDLVVVPYSSEFYVAKIAGRPFYDPTKVEEDSAYRRPVNWLNKRRPIPRQVARSPLLARMKTQGTSAGASDLLDEVQECLLVSGQEKTPTFQTDLQLRLTREVVKEIRGGRIDSFGFERLIQGVLVRLGAVEARIIPRSEDKGADIVATFLVAGAFVQKLAVQAKHWHPNPPVERDVVEQLIRGIEAEGASLGMVVTAGSIGSSAVAAAEQYFDEKGIRIELVHGDQFAKLIVESGVVAAPMATP